MKTENLIYSNQIESSFYKENQGPKGGDEDEPVPYICSLEENGKISFKAELLQEGIFFLIHLFARDVSVVKKLEIKKTKPTFIISVLKIEY